MNDITADTGHSTSITAYKSQFMARSRSVHLRLLFESVFNHNIEALRFDCCETCVKEQLVKYDQNFKYSSKTKGGSISPK